MGFGLSDGEGMERLWSYMRRFSAMTKEMQPSHRIDVLTDAIVLWATLVSHWFPELKMCKLMFLHVCT